MCLCCKQVSYWDLQPAGLDDQWWAGSSSPCLPQNHPTPPSRFSPTCALKIRTCTRDKATNIQEENKQFFSPCFNLQWAIFFNSGNKMVGIKVKTNNCLFSFIWRAILEWRSHPHSIPSVLVSCCRRVFAVMTSILWILQNSTTSLHSNCKNHS